MEFALDLLEKLGGALAGLALNPFYYAALLIAAICYRRQVVMQRRLFHVRLHASAGVFLHALMWGWICGLALSVAAMATGLVLNVPTMLWLWGTALVLALFRVRYSGTIYAAGAVILLHEAATGLGLLDVLREWPVAGRALAALEAVHPPSLLALAALLYAAEALLVRLFGERYASPLYVDGIRGKTIGAYQLHGFWALPLFLVVPAAPGAGLAGGWPWPFFFGGGAAWEAGWTLLAVPALVGFTAMSAADLPGRRMRRSAALLLAFAALLAALAAVSELWPFARAAAAVGALLAPLLHEGIVIRGERLERRGKPFFVHDGEGLKVLAVVPGGPAAEMGIAPGETILKVNGAAVSRGEELHAALRLNPAFCKLQVSDLNGESKFVQRALFAGEHHQLGIVLCPDDRVTHYARWRPLTLFTLLAPDRRAVQRRGALLADVAVPGEAGEPQSEERSGASESAAAEAAVGAAGAAGGVGPKADAEASEAGTADAGDEDARASDAAVSDARASDAAVSDARASDTRASNTRVSIVPVSNAQGSDGSDKPGSDEPAGRKGSRVAGSGTRLKL